MEVMISVYGETSHIGEVFHCGDAYATIVSVDAQGSPVEVPFVLCPQTPEERLRCAHADKRLGFRQRINTMLGAHDSVRQLTTLLTEEDLQSR